MFEPSKTAVQGDGLPLVPLQFGLSPIVLDDGTGEAPAIAGIIIGLARLIKKCVG